jgi:NTE family protein
MSRALVLGGGGPVGIGWEAGLVLGLADGGVDLNRADLVVGTSAGSVVGAHLRLGTDLAAYVEEQAEAIARGDLDVPTRADVPPEQVARFIEVLGQAQEAATPEDGRALIGRYAAETPTVVTEERFTGYFDELAGRPWPDRFTCTAVETATGAFTTWDASSGVDLQLAVAASCAVPGIFPPVTVAGGRYMDGGTHSSLNTALAAGHDVALVVIVLAYMLPPGLSEPRIEHLAARQQAELDELAGAGTKVECVRPDQELLDLTAWGLELMDTGRAATAFEVGRRRGRREAERLLDFWS